MTDNTIRERFSKWCTKERIEIDLFTDKTACKALNEIGIKVNSIFEETNITKIRLYLSELLFKQDVAKIESFNSYKSIMLFLLNYAEFLKHKDEEEQNVSADINENGERDKQRDSLIIGYYLSRRNYDGIKELGIRNMNDAFRSIGLLLDKKPSTIQNLRDSYDPYFDNGRVGWYQRPLTGMSKEVYNELEKLSDAELFNLVEEIMDYYKNLKKNRKSSRSRIVITDYHNKEIKSKR